MSGKGKDQDIFDTLEYSDKFSKKDAIKSYKSNNAKNVQDVLRKAAQLEQYKIGDILVRLRWGRNGNYETMSDNATKTKYEVVHLSEEGIVFAKKFLQSGELGNQIFCLNADAHAYEIDPDLVDHILLDEEDSYDPAESIAKVLKKKQKAQSINKKTAYILNRASHRERFFNDMNYGDIIWHAWGFLGQGAKQYIVHADNGNSLELQRYDGTGPRYYYDNITIYRSAKSSYYFWKDKPKTVKDMLDGTDL